MNMIHHTKPNIPFPGNPVYVVTLHGLNLVSSSVVLDHNESDKQKKK